MKLRYYLRGLAVGILIATIVLTIANRDNRPLTDAQIRSRALQLGMVEESSLKLSDLPGSESPASTDPQKDPEPQSESPAVAESEPESESESQEVAEQEPESESESESPVVAESEPESESESESPVVAESEPESQSESESPAVAESEPESQSESPAVVESEPESQSENPEGTVTLVIKKGANSYNVCKDLAAAGLIEDAVAFDNYLGDNGYAKRIHAGTYQIPFGISEKEIAQIIAK